ncbi:MAG: aromatic ring-hydroxylating dioxygenase subunit alpha [Rhodanobacter sp.]|nr:MAG: aromatic ring-hydroxylating dioxygenase subunit alpha [Rhodanobacter sp.]
MNDKTHIPHHHPTDEVEALLNRGLRNVWYPVTASWAVQNAPIGITCLGDNIALWRDNEGKVHALEDRCPHRGARLSLGWNLGDQLACWYHGVQVNGEGKVMKVPAVADCPMEGQCCVRHYPVHEAAGAIFLYFGDEAHPEPPALELPEQLVGEEYDRFLCMAHWNCNYRYALDNVMDPAHGAFLHSVSHSMAGGDRRADMRVTKIENGIRFEKTNQQGVNFDWTEYKETGAMYLHLAIPYQKKYTGGEFAIIGFATPVDENHTTVFFWRGKKVKGWERDLWRFMYKNRLEGMHWAVLEQDRLVLEDMAPNARDHEFLYQHDIGLTRLRRMMEKTAKEQVAALHAWREVRAQGAAKPETPHV